MDAINGALVFFAKRLILGRDLLKISAILSPLQLPEQKKNSLPLFAMTAEISNSLYLIPLSFVRMIHSRCDTAGSHVMSVSPVLKWLSCRSYRIPALSRTPIRGAHL